MGLTQFSHYKLNRITNMSFFSKKDSGAPVAEKKLKEVRETKCTCQACGNVWYYGKDEVRKNCSAAASQVSKSMMCCSGCWPALFIPNETVVNLDKCPKCGSKAVTKEVVTHYV